MWEAFLDPSDSYFLFADLVGFYTNWTYMLIFRRIFLTNYWWQRSDIWSQASYRYPISFLDPSDSYFLFAEERGYRKWALAHSSSCWLSFYCWPLLIILLWSTLIFLILLLSTIIVYPFHFDHYCLSFYCWPLLFICLLSTIFVYPIIVDYHCFSHYDLRYLILVCEFKETWGYRS